MDSAHERLISVLLGTAPSPTKKKKHFSEWVAVKNHRFTLDYDEYVDKHGRLPENPKDIPMLKSEGRLLIQCRQLKNPSTLNYFTQGEKRLALYERGELTIEEYMQPSYDRCRPFSLQPAPPDTPMR
jgi:hypothetical protein